jgi:cbb3-type cytochrome oxidase subunit 3
MIDQIFIALPGSFIVTFAIWIAYRAMNKHDLDESHIDRCFKGM